MYNFHTLHIDTKGRTSGRLKTFCPQCRDQRKDKRDKSLSVDLDKGLYYCHYCTWTGTAAEPNRRTDYPRAASLVPPRPVARPVAKPAISAQEAPLTAQQIAWFATQRHIPAEVLTAMQVTSATEYLSQTGKPEACICFNYLCDGERVNTKFRDLAKNFKLIQGGQLVPYNIDAIFNTPECIITEGEIDALSFVTAGRTDVISVPNGANTNLTWMDTFFETHFESKHTFYIAVDTDRKGVELRNELLRRLGMERCRIVDFGPHCKDANECLVQHGTDGLLLALKNAPQPPLEGVFTVADYSHDLRALFENGLGRGADTGLENFDALCTFEPGRLCVVTGIPNDGKSEFVDELVLRLNLRHHWKAAYFSPENVPLSYHMQKLAEKLTGCHFRQGYMPENLYTATEMYLRRNIFSILPRDKYTLTHILASARGLVHRHGITTLVIDPLNRLEHLIPPGQTETQYLSALVDQLTNFAQRNRCLIILVAHPRKMNREPGMKKAPVPSLYDINGSAAFFNKCDFGLVVERDREAQLTRVHVEKVRFRNLGSKGVAAFSYNTINGRYTPCEENPSATLPQDRTKRLPFDNTCWLNLQEIFSNSENP